MIAMFLVIGVAAVVLMVVVMGTEGHGRTRTRHPELAQRMARAAQHLNGEGDVPAGIERLVTRRR